MSDIAQPQAVFFDMDGTLLDWETGLGTSWLRACEAHADASGIAPATLHAAIDERRTWFWNDAQRAYTGRFDLRRASRDIVQFALEDVGAGEQGDVAQLIADTYRDLRDDTLGLYDGAIETLERLRADGVALALITNGAAVAQRRNAERFGLAPYFGCVVIEGEFGYGKPDERVFRHALATLGCEPERTWMVGDYFEADIVTPHAMGMHTVWIDAADAGLPADAPCEPHRTIRHISELLEAPTAS